MKKAVTLFLIIIYHCSAFAQSCNCEQNFNWMVKTFTENDAGYQFIIDKKGKDALNTHTSLIQGKVKGITNPTVCQTLLADWLKFFRGGHIGINLIATNNSSNTNSETPEMIRSKYKNSERIPLTTKKFIEQYSKTATHHPLEGIWRSKQYTIAILPSKDKLSLNGVVLKADSIYWMPGQIKMKIATNPDADGYITDYAMRDHSINKTSLSIMGKSSNIINLVGSNWCRIYPETKYSIMDSIWLNMETQNPYLNRLSKNTLYLRIPSFNHLQKPFIDSVLNANDSIIKSTQNLIIDIRYGTGGSDFAYNNIMPYLYTNPIRNVGTRVYATELNAKTFEGYAKIYSDTASSNEQLRTAEEMRKNLGKFIGSDTTQIYTDTLETVFPFPKHVAIVCNHNNGSTDEQFLFDAKQSKKVKVFGTPTGGMLDFSNVSSANSPDGYFQLYYTTTKSYRVPSYCIDDIGIQPDIYLDSSLPEYNWIDFVKDYLEN